MQTLIFQDDDLIWYKSGNCVFLTVPVLCVPPLHSPLSAVT